MGKSIKKEVQKAKIPEHIRSISAKKRLAIERHIILDSDLIKPIY